MKIGLYDPYLDTLSGGEKYMLSAASCLAKEHEVFIFWNKDKENEIKRTALRKLGIDLSSVNFYSNIFDKSRPFVSRFFESGKFDAIIFLSDGSIPFVRAKLFIHFQFPVEWINGKSIKNRIKLLFVKKILCNSYFTKSFIDKKLNVESDILYPPVDLHVNKNIAKENLILHVGRFDVNQREVNYKKQDVMIDIFKKMIKAGLKDWKLKLIIGVKDKDKVKLSRISKAAKGYPIELMENISNQELWINYSKAKIYWHASGFGEDLGKFPDRAEHFGISTAEAMGAGCVPVVFNAGGQREIVEDGKSGFLWDTLGDFAKKTRDLIEDEKLRKKMSDNAMRRSRVFTGNRFCKDLKAIIK